MEIVKPVQKATLVDIPEVLLVLLGEVIGRGLSRRGAPSW